MTLLEQALLERMRLKQIGEAIEYPHLRSMVTLTGHIEDLLKTSDLTEVQKLHQLQQAQERYTKSKDNMRQAATPEIVIAGPGPDMGIQVPAAATGQATTASVTGPVVDFSAVTQPPQYADKFAKFHEFVGSRLGLLDKNEKEEVVLEGKTIEGSSFLDLLRQMFVPTASLNVTGVGDLSNAFGKAKLPSTCISTRLNKTVFDPALASAPHFEFNETTHTRKKPKRLEAAPIPLAQG